MRVPFIITDSSITVYVEGRPLTVPSDGPFFNDLREHLKGREHDPKAVYKMAYIPARIEGECYGDVTVGDDGVIYYKGIASNSVMADKILRLLEEGFDVSSWAFFMDNLLKNPSTSSRAQLYSFLSRCDLPITEDGHLLAYKKVRSDYMDCHTWSIDNSVGSLVEMPREEVSDDPNSPCSAGLHFCARGYLNNFGGARTVVVKVNPADVVSIPKDGNFQKARCCKYEVVGELEDDSTATRDEFESKAVSSDYDTLEEEEEICDDDEGVCFGCGYPLDECDDAWCEEGDVEDTVTEEISFTHKRTGNTFTKDQLLGLLADADSVRKLSISIKVPRSTLQDWIKKCQ